MLPLKLFSSRILCWISGRYLRHNNFSGLGLEGDANSLMGSGHFDQSTTPIEGSNGSGSTAEVELASVCTLLARLASG